MRQRYSNTACHSVQNRKWSEHVDSGNKRGRQKHTVLAQSIKRLIEECGAPASRIISTSFSLCGSSETKDKLDQCRLSEKIQSVGTFHKWASCVLQSHRLMNEADRLWTQWCHVRVLAMDPIRQRKCARWKIDFWFVDEVQDNNGMFNELLLRFKSPNRSIIVAGDDRQDIMSFQSSNTTYMRRFESDFAPCKVIL